MKKTENCSSPSFRLCLVCLLFFSTCTALSCHHTHVLFVLLYNCFYPCACSLSLSHTKHVQKNGKLSLYFLFACTCQRYRKSFHPPGVVSMDINNLFHTHTRHHDRPLLNAAVLLLFLYSFSFSFAFFSLSLSLIFFFSSSSSSRVIFVHFSSRMYLL